MSRGYRIPVYVLAPVILAIAAIVGMGGQFAWAHAALVSSTPADGAQLASAPANVVLTFNENITEVGLQIAAMNSQGQAVDLTPVSVAGPEVTIPWPQDQPEDGYRVAYRVVSEDGHPINGSIAFSYGDASPPSSAATSTATTEVDQAEQSSTSTPWWIAGIVILGVAIGAGLAYWMRRGKNAANDAPSADNTDSP